MNYRKYLLLILLFLVSCTKDTKDIETTSGRITDIRTSPWCSEWAIVLNYNYTFLTDMDNAELLKLRYKHVQITYRPKGGCFYYNKIEKLDTIW